MPEKQYDTKFCHFQFPDPKSRHFDVDVCEESSEATSKTNTLSYKIRSERVLWKACTGHFVLRE